MLLYPKRAEKSVAAINHATALAAGRTRAMNGTHEILFLFLLLNNSEGLAARLATDFPTCKRNPFLPTK